MNTICSYILSHGSRCHWHLAFGRRLYHKNLSTSQEDSLQLARNLYDGVEPTIGLEIHAQLKINSKLFSQGGNLSQAPANTQLDLLDISLPGTLPKLNKAALKSAISSCFGLKSAIQDLTYFDRKNYFYTDMPAGYQITQYNRPLAKNGHIDFIVSTYHKSLIAHSVNYDLVRHVFWRERHLHEEFTPYVRTSRIRQIQLEQDSAKSFHEDDSYSLVDYNRSGAALIEVVFEPDLCTHHEASSLVKKLIQTLKALDTCDCELQEGSLRIDANISIKSLSGQKVDRLPRVELKNLNSLKALNKGIKHEILRQANLIRAGQKVVQESRTYDTKSDKTVSMRLKEEAVDYRYVPEPNIPPVRISRELVSQVSENIPKSLPCDDDRLLVSEYGLDLLLVSDIADEPGLCRYFRDVMEKRHNYNANIVADFLIYTMHNLRELPNVPIRVELQSGSQFMQRLSPDRMQSIIDLVVRREIGFTVAYALIRHIYISGDQSEPREIMQKLGWAYITDETYIDELCMKCIESMKGVAKNYTKKGLNKHLFALTNRMCELTHDKVDVELAIQRFDKLLKPTRHEIT